MATFRFTCKNPEHPEEDFSIEREQNDTNKLGKVFCPACGQQWGAMGSIIELKMNVATFSRSHSAIRDENLEASRHAEEMARRDRADLDRVDPLVAPGVRKSAVDAINERANQLGL